MSHGDIAVHESEGQEPALILIHGNSTSATIFKHTLTGAMGQQYRAIAIDLPGQDDSADVINPKATNSIEGYANAISELLAQLAIENAVVVG